MTRGAPAFYDAAEFAFTAALERHCAAITEEYRAIRGHLVDWPEKELYGDGWAVAGLFDFPHGAPIEANIARCPVTAALVREHIPHHGAVGFSVLRPMTTISPHRGYQGPFLRCHLGVEIPEGDCGLRVGQETRRWRTGTALVFDDRLPHDAWNLTAHERVILLVDFIPST